MCSANLVIRKGLRVNVQLSGDALRLSAVRGRNARREVRMGRTLMTIILLAAVTLAQSTGVASEPQMHWRSGERHSLDGVVSEQYDKLRQGTAGYFSVNLTSSELFAVGSAGTKDRRIMPTVLEFEPMPGFEISKVLYPDMRFGKFHFDEKPFRVFLHNGPDSTRIRFKIRATDDVAPGHYVLKGCLKFQYVSNAGISEPQQLGVDVPVEVAAHTAKVQIVDRSAAGIRGVTPVEVLEGIVLIPLTLPLGIFMALIGWDGC